MKDYHYIDSIFNKLFKPKIYNYFICKKGVALFIKEKNIIKETIIFYNDKEFLRKLPKTPYEFYLKALEKFLKEAKKRLQKGETVYLYFDKYKFELSKKNFYIYKNNTLIIHNFLSSIEYINTNEIVINPFTNKKIKFFAPKIVYDFFKFYFYGFSKFTNYTKNKKYKNAFLIFLYDIFFFILFFGFWFGFMALFFYIDSLISKNFNYIRAGIETIVAIIIAEFLIDFLKSKIYY